MLDHLKRWATTFGTSEYSFSDLTSPAIKALEMLCDSPQHFSGQVIYINDIVESFCIWEKPVLEALPANQLVVCSTNSIKGLSEWQVVKMCEELHENGTRQVNIGGSECHGLDRFKRKFAPISSRSLESIKVENM